MVTDTNSVKYLKIYQSYGTVTIFLNHKITNDNWLSQINLDFTFYSFGRVGLHLHIQFMLKLQNFGKSRTVTVQSGSLDAKIVPESSNVWFSLIEARFYFKIWEGKIGIDIKQSRFLDDFSAEMIKSRLNVMFKISTQLVLT